MILSAPLCATTQDTMENTHRGVNFITQDMKVNIPLLIVSVIVLSCIISSRFQYEMRAIQNIIPIVTICIALSSTKASTILSGIIQSKKLEKLRASSLSGVKLLNSKFTHFPGLKAFMSIREVLMARVVVSI